MCLVKIWESSENSYSDLVGQGWGLRFCISNKHMGDTDVADLRTVLIISKNRGKR